MAKSCGKHFDLRPAATWKRLRISSRAESRCLKRVCVCVCPEPIHAYSVTCSSGALPYHHHCLDSRPFNPLFSYALFKCTVPDTRFLALDSMLVDLQPFVLGVDVSRSFRPRTPLLAQFWTRLASESCMTLAPPEARSRGRANTRSLRWRRTG